MSRRRTSPFRAERSSRFIAVSVALHVLVIVLVVRYVMIPGRWERWLADHRAEEAPVERIGFVALPRGATTEPGRAGGDGRPLEAQTVAPMPLVAPREIPVGIPPVPEAAAPPSIGGGSGPVVGRGGPLQGIAPHFDSPLWAPVSPETTAPRNSAEEIADGISARVELLNDSLERMRPTGRAPGDWTFRKGDKKYGIDQRKIYIGPVEIPTAVLALLPLNLQANPQDLERNRAMAYQRGDIMNQAQRAVTEEEFREAVKRIRERRERERAEAAAKQSPVVIP